MPCIICLIERRGFSIGGCLFFILVYVHICLRNSENSFCLMSKQERRTGSGNIDHFHWNDKRFGCKNANGIFVKNENMQVIPAYLD